MRKKQDLKYKQLAFDTAMRNPERLRDLVEIMFLFEGRVLDDKCLLEIMCTLHIKKFITRTIIPVSVDTRIVDIEDIVFESYKTRKAEGGFPSGTSTRFYNYTKTLSEFGLIYAQYGKQLKFSKTIKLWLDQKIDAQNVFAMHSMMYNRSSPHRRVANDFNYFIFIVGVLKKCNKLSYKEFIISLFDKDGDSQLFIDVIKNNKFVNNEDLYMWLCNNYENVKIRRTVLKDYPDVVLRMLRITGFFDIIYKGEVYIQLNTARQELLSQFIEIPFKLSDNSKNDALLYFTEINNNIDKFLDIVLQQPEEYKRVGATYVNNLENIISTYDLSIDKVSSYLIGKSRDPNEFKYISDPLKLEFYISLLIFMKYKKEFYIRPNYKIDSLGMPISHAPAYKGDIEVYSLNLYWLIEVTLIKNKTQQLNHETTSVMRHFQSEKTKYNEKYLSFIAPVIHEDTRNFYKISLIMLNSNEDQVYGATYNIEKFIDTLINKNIFENMKEYFHEAKQELRDKL